MQDRNETMTLTAKLIAGAHEHAVHQVHAEDHGIREFDARF